MQDCQGQNDPFSFEEIDRTQENPKGIWNALSGSGRRTTKIVELETENGTVYDESSLANEFNDFSLEDSGTTRKGRSPQ